MTSEHVNSTSWNSWMFAALVSGLSLSAASNAAPRPNVIVIVADDLGYADLGVHGCKDIPTPHIDSLAKNGVRCTNGYVSGPYCSPTRAGLMTGRYQQRFGHEFNPGPPSEVNQSIGLARTETTIADRMRAAGYVTGMIGKWHLGHADQFHPLQRGFGEYFGFLGGAHQYFPGGRGAAGVLRGKSPVHETEYLTDAFAREAAAFIDRHKAEPFFLCLTFNAVHAPMQAADKYLGRFTSVENGHRRTYAAMLAAMDDAIGVVLGRLRAAKIEDDTLIFFISDNGGPEPSNASNNGILRGQKAQTWEGGIHVPFLVQWKSRLPAGKVYEEPVIQLDILPTALAAAGVAASRDWKLDGVNLLPYLQGKQTSPPHEALYWRFGQQMAIRKGDWKLIKAPGGGLEPGGARRGVANTDGALLFHLKDDPAEERDLSSSRGDVAINLAAAWKAWNSQLAKPEWGPPDRGSARKARKATKKKAAVTPES